MMMLEKQSKKKMDANSMVGSLQFNLLVKISVEEGLSLMINADIAVNWVTGIFFINN